MEKIRVSVSNKQHVIKIPAGVRLFIRRCCTAVLQEENFEKSAEVSVSFVTNEEIKRLNAFYRNKDIETDVLSFPLGENGEYDINPETGACCLGDIVISMEMAVKQAEIYGHSLLREIGFLTVHSMLHLLGYDHETDGFEAIQMREKEEKILTSLGVPRNTGYRQGYEEIY